MCSGNFWKALTYIKLIFSQYNILANINNSYYNLFSGLFHQLSPKKSNQEH